MHFLADYGLYLAKLATFIIAALILLSGIIAIASKGKEKDKTAGKLKVKPLNEHYRNLKESVNQITLPKHLLKEGKKALKKNLKDLAKKDQKRIFVIDFSGDIKASQVTELREAVTAVILAHREGDQVLIRLESPGGMVNAYGLAASQINRLRDANIHITIAVDKIAASGGYMMACLADKIIAAPFAILGSIGVISQLPNFHRLLDKHKIDFEQITAGEYKRTLTMFGKNTAKGRQKMQEDINDIHELFKNFIKRFRPQVDLDKAATGEYWFGTRALDLNLVDELQTSDAFLVQAKDDHALFEVKYVIKKPISKKLSVGLTNLLAKVSSQSTGGQDYL